MSNSSKRKLKRARQQLHEKGNLIKLYKERIADPNALVDYVQGLAAFGQYALEVMEAQSADRSFLVWEALRAWATMNGMLVADAKGKLTITKVYQRADETSEPPTQMAQAD
jgi:hypothetical protein